MLKHATLQSAVCYFMAMIAVDSDLSLNSNERVYATFGHCLFCDTDLLIAILLQAVSNRTMTSTVFSISVCSGALNVALKANSQPK